MHAHDDSVIGMQRPELDTLDDYRLRFADAEYWAPHVRRVCERHRLRPCDAICNRVPGTYPTFIVDERWVVKFFGQRFEGARVHAAEQSANQAVAGQRAIPAPAILASGRLFDDAGGWSWPYLIFACAPGESLGQAGARASFDDRLAVAERLGGILRALHELPLPDSGPLASGDAYAALIARTRRDCAANHRGWGVPEHLASQMEAFLKAGPPLAGVAPRLIHADVTADHVLGRAEGGRWRMTALIDFGDAMAGDPAYDLVALHLDAFRCEARLLRAFLAAYGAGGAERQALLGRAKALTLLHQFNALGVALERVPGLAGAPDLAGVLSGLWDGAL